MNSFGRLFRVSIFGESHGPGVGVVIDGCPAGVPLSPEDLGADLKRRAGGGKGATARIEPDRPEFLSGVWRGKTTGAPLAMFIPNRDADSAPYDKIKDTPRPSHADLAARIRFGGHNDYRGGGHFSGRLTAALTAAGSVAKILIAPVRPEAEILSAGGSSDPAAAAAEAAAGGDSVGGLIECRLTAVPPGLGEPFFDSVESVLAHLLFSVGGVKGVEFGAGFAAARMRGSEYNDAIVSVSGRTETNRDGGINGGLTNGNDIVFRVAVRPTASIARSQRTVDLATGKPAEIEVSGRHDACIALRAAVVVEAVAALVLCDLMSVAGLIPRVWKP